VEIHTPHIQQRSVTAGGVDFSLLESGPEDGRLVICLHGFPDSAWTWRHLLPALGASGYHAVAPFLRGYAPTGLAPDGSYQIGALAADACALEELLGSETPSILVGHDWGAFAAYGAACLRPERFAKVVGMAAPPVAAVASTFFSYEQVKRSFYVFFFQSSLAVAVVGADDCRFISRLWADWSPGYDASWDVARVKESIGNPERLTAAIGYYRAMFDPSTHLDIYERAQQAAQDIPTQPTLYFHGAEDGCMGVDVTSGLGSLLADGSETLVVTGAGHFLHLERPAEVHANLLRFISS
jgi:pimeloyl-ACP methyl ester carboxylesterase